MGKKTYSQLHVHLVFSTKYRMPLIKADIRESVERYITVAVQEKGHKLMAVYCMPDHCHLLIGLNPNESISDLLRHVKSHSSRWINKERLIRQRFRWQEGYGAFSVDRFRIQQVINYILNQPDHHARRNFEREYLEILSRSGVEHDPQYVFG